MSVLTIGFVLSCRAGEAEDKRRPIKVKKHGRSAQSLFRAKLDRLVSVLFRGMRLLEVLERVHSLRSRIPKKAKTIICRPVLNLRSQFFQSRLFFSNQEKLRSTTHRFGNTAKRCNSFRLTTSTSAPINSCTDEANALPV